MLGWNRVGDGVVLEALVPVSSPTTTVTSPVSTCHCPSVVDLNRTDSGAISLADT